MSADNIAQGYGRAYIAPYVASSVEALPADTVARDGAWGGNWASLGFTGGVQWSSGQEFNHVEVDQSTLEVRSFVTKQNIEVELTLKETTVENVKYALGFGTLSTSGSSGVLTISENPVPLEWTIGLEGPSPDASATAAQRIRFDRLVAISEPEMVFSREEETVVVAQFHVLRGPSGSAGQVRQYRP
jgi:hypothetical protein